MTRLLNSRQSPSKRAVGMRAIKRALAQARKRNKQGSKQRQLERDIACLKALNDFYEKSLNLRS